MGEEICMSPAVPPPGWLRLHFFTRLHGASQHAEGISTNRASSPVYPCVYTTGGGALRGPPSSLMLKSGSQAERRRGRAWDTETCRLGLSPCAAPPGWVTSGD